MRTAKSEDLIPVNIKLNDYLNRSINAFSEICNIPVTFFDYSHRLIQEYNASERICNFFNIYCDTCGPCRQRLAEAGDFSAKVEEPYVFFCKGKLTNIAVPVIIEDEVAGYFIAGPLIAETQMNSVVENITKLNNLSVAAETLAKMFLKKKKTYNSLEISQLSILLYNSVTASTSRLVHSHVPHTVRRAQREINLEEKRKAREMLTADYPVLLEQSLIDSIFSCNTELALENTEKMLNAISTMEDGDIDGIKNNVFWLISIISRLFSENQSIFTPFPGIDSEFTDKIFELSNFNEIMELTKNFVTKITSDMLSNMYTGDSHVISRAIKYINQNYTSKISLQDIEDNLGVNQSYFSTLFRQETGKTFVEYTHQLKMQYACFLLENTNLSIQEISEAIGFDDQSYFTKVFKKQKDITPKKWREKNRHLPLE